MATFFSDNLADPTDNTDLGVSFRASAGIKHARTRTAISRVTALALTTDTVRMVTLRSSDRLLGLELATDGGSTAGAVNVGLHLAGSAHDGAVEDADMFATAVVVSTETDLVDIMTEGTLIDGVDRGRTMWEIATLGAGTNYTEDPHIDFDITLTASTSLSVAASELTLKAIYTSGD